MRKRMINPLPRRSSSSMIDGPGSTVRVLRSLPRQVPRYKEEAADIFAFPLLDRDSCAEFVASVKNSADWLPALVRNQVGPDEYVTSVQRDARVAEILDSAEMGDLYYQFEQKMDEIVKPLIKTTFGITLEEHGGTQVLHYPPGGHYVPHQDAVSDLLYRYFTVVCYLNDDFEGGRTWFPSLGYSAQPRTGTAIIFPSRFYHCAQPVLRGEKFVIISWVNGPMPIQWI
jgi:predicted 2-oxoglutarate/Fe(II)-dependent dioxygenase YbiX